MTYSSGFRKVDSSVEISGHPTAHGLPYYSL